MAGIPHPVEPPAPPDEWLTLTEAERLAIQRKLAAAEFDGSWDAVQVAIDSESPDPTPDEAEIASPLSLPSTFDDVLRSAGALDLDDRVRLIGQLWQTLPLKNRAASVMQGLQTLEQTARETLQQPAKEKALEFWRELRRILFDPTHISGLYSAPRQFDLATLFVAMAAYSLLFGLLSAMDFGPMAIIAMGLITAVVAVSQSVTRGKANPRGVSIIAGTAALVVFSLFLFAASPRIFNRSIFLAVLNGAFFGPMLGYMAGAMVGGVFLAADALRGKAKRNEEQLSDGHSKSAGA